MVRDRSKGHVTSLLADIGDGRPAARDELLAVLYDELRDLARWHMQQERGDHTLQTTALVHEAYLRLVDEDTTQPRDRSHFLRLAAKVMRQVLIDHARTKRALKRGGGRRIAALDEAAAFDDDSAEELISLDEALTGLATLDEQMSQIVELRFFGGFSVDETARVLDISTATVKRDWRAAKAWLHRELVTGDRDG